MSNAMFVQWKNPLTALVAKPGGLRVQAALDRADKNLETIRDTCLASFDEQLIELVGLNRPGQPAPSEDVRRETYRIANEMYGLAGVFGLTELGRAAYSLCELVDRLAALGRWHQAAVDVHVSALILLRRPEADMDTTNLFERLRVLTDQIDQISA